MRPWPFGAKIDIGWSISLYFLTVIPYILIMTTTNDTKDELVTVYIAPEPRTESSDRLEVIHSSDTDAGRRIDYTKFFEGEK